MVNEITHPKIKAIMNYILCNKAVTKLSFYGCSLEEIAEVEQAQGVKLPLVYKAFLSMMGRNAGWLCGGDDFYYPALLKLKNEGEISEGFQGRELPKDAFVFLFHDGCAFAYFRTENTGDDPPVFLVPDVRDEPVQVSDSYTEYLVQLLDDYFNKPIPSYDEIMTYADKEPFDWSNPARPWERSRSHDKHEE